jgi:hypothetical protein
MRSDSSGSLTGLEVRRAMSRIKTHWMNTRADRLTNRQEANLPAVCEKWRKIALSTEPADRKKARDALHAAYRMFNRKPPKVSWLDSIFKLTEDLIVAQGVRLAIPTRWRSIELGAVRFYKDRVVKDVDRVIDASVPDTMSPLRVLPLSDKGVTQNWVGNISGSYLGTDSAGPLAMADFFATKWHAVFNILIPVLENCAGLFIFEKSALLLERPRVIKLDQRGRLHAFDGPALEYRDGSVIHAIHGVRLDKKWIEKPAEELEIDEIMQEQNAGIRSALIAKLGFERLMKKAHYRIVSKYRGNALIEFKFPGRRWISEQEPNIETIWFRALHLKWRDKTGERETILPVPRTLRQFGNDRPANPNSCEQVRRWTLGWPKEAMAVAET